MSAVTNWKEIGYLTENTAVKTAVILNISHVTAPILCYAACAIKLSMVMFHAISWRRSFPTSHSVLQRIWRMQQAK
jgi:hypothetical protein